MKNIFILIILSFTFISCAKNQSLVITDTKVDKSEAKKVNKSLSNKCGENYKEFKEVFTKEG